VTYLCHYGNVNVPFVVYYISINREVKTRPIYGCRCDERLKTNDEEFTRLPYTGLFNEVFVYYESRKRDLQTRPVYECRCDERLKTKTEKSTRLTHTELIGELEHLKIKTRLINEMFETVMGNMCF
jgi:hypothetical protein